MLTRDDLWRQFDLEGRVAVVTGASSGLGERFARVLAAAGARVVLAARRVERLEALADELPGSLPIRCDMTDDAAITRLFGATLEALGNVDILVNNAGIMELGPAEDEALEQFRRVVDVNLVGAFAAAQLAARAMLASGSGSIVNVGSVHGLRGIGQVPAAGYAASKGGLVSLTRELAAQWSRRGIRVNAIAPANFVSEITAEGFRREGALQWLRRKTPIGRVGEPHELDGALLYLASDASTYVTGQILSVDGGWTAL